MKKILIILMVLLAASLAFAEDLVGFASGTFSDADELSAFAFVTSLDALMQGNGAGGLIAFDENGDVVLAWSVDGTPTDFFTELPENTLVTPCAVTVPLARAYFASLGCPTGVFDGMAQNSYIMLVSVWKSNGEVLEDYRYTFAEKSIWNKATAQGVEASMVFDYWRSRGYTDDQVIWSVAAGHSVDDIVLTAIKAERADPSRRETKDSTILILLGVSVFVLLCGTVTVIVIVKRKKS
jgi:hypothetical protein